MRLLCKVLATLVIALGVATPALARSESASYSIWTVDGATVRVRFMLPVNEAKRLLPDTPRLDDSLVASTAGSLLAVTSAGGECTPLVQDQWVGKYYILAAAEGAYRFEMTFQCPDAKRVVLHDGVLFDSVPDHIDYAKVRIGSGVPVLRLFTRTHMDLALPGAGPPPAEGWRPFAKQGLDRLLLGADAAALIAGLLLVSRRWRDLADIALALSLGYGAALAMVWRSGLAPSVGLASAGMGAMAAILGLCALRRQAGDREARRSGLAAGLAALALGGASILAMAAGAGRIQLLTAAGLVLFGLSQAWLAGSGRKLGVLLFAPAFLFGLFDGTVWAQRLSRLNLPGEQLMKALWGYDLGALASLVATAGVAMSLLWLAGRKLKMMQPFGADLAAAALTGVGLFWFVSRLYSV